MDIILNNVKVSAVFIIGIGGVSDGGHRVGVSISKEIAMTVEEPGDPRLRNLNFS